MIEVIVDLAADLGFERLFNRTENRTTAQQISPFLGVVFGSFAIALAVVSGPLYGVAAGIIAVASFSYGA